MNNITNNKLLLALLPYWDPMLPPHGISRLKRYLQTCGYTVKTIDANLEKEFKELYDSYYHLMKSDVPADRQGNFYNIVNDVWREHMMAHINYEEKNKYIQLIKTVVYKTFYYEISDERVLELDKILTSLYQWLETYLIDILEREKPDVLGISTFRDTLATTLFAFRLTRKKFPHIKTVMGGGIFSIQLPIDSPNMEYFLEETKPYIDKIIIGEGEKLLVKYLRGELSDSQRVYTLKDIDGEKLGFSTGLPDYSDFDFSNYYYLPAQGSRGCPFRCSFCNVASFFGKFAIKSPRQTAAEMVELHKKYKSQLFLMLDSLLNPVIDELAKELLKFEDISLYWDGYLRVDKAAASMDNTLLWRRAGLYRARLGVESGSQALLDLMNKQITVEQIKTAVSNLARVGVKTTLYFVIGHPGETEEDFQQTLKLIEDLKNHAWEVECNPFTYIYSGQSGGAQWEKNRTLLYPQWARDMLITQTWVLECEPSRQEMFRRINRFAAHCKKLGFNNNWSIENIKKADERWSKLHKNAVPPLLDLVSEEHLITECKNVKPLILARDNPIEDDQFIF